MGMTAQPSAPAAPKSLLSDVLDVFNVLHEPTAVFTRVKERPRILAPWIVFSLVQRMGHRTSPFVVGPTTLSTPFGIAIFSCEPCAPSSSGKARHR